MQDRHPRIRGNVEVADAGDRIVIAGDPEGLRALATVLVWLADVDQEKAGNLPTGDRMHIHLSPGAHISYDSRETEICRLDAKGTGEFPKVYRPA